METRNDLAAGWAEEMVNGDICPLYRSLEKPNLPIHADDVEEMWLDWMCSYFKWVLLLSKGNLIDENFFDGFWKVPVHIVQTVWTNETEGTDVSLEKALEFLLLCPIIDAKKTQEYRFGYFLALKMLERMVKSLNE